MYILNIITAIIYEKILENNKKLQKLCKRLINILQHFKNTTNVNKHRLQILSLETLFV